MPRHLNYLNHEECPPEDDKNGWELHPAETWDVPLWMERMGMLDLPDWMRNVDGTCSVNYKAGMGSDKPDVYVTSLAAPSERPQDPRPRDLCRFFAKTGSCRFAEQCHYAHESGVAKDDPRLKTGGGWIKDKDLKKSFEQVMREAREKREDEAGKKVKVCSYYGTYDGCKKGVHCLNRHIDE